MKKLQSILLGSLLVLTGIVPLIAQDVVELKLPESNKIIVKLMFINGSSTDPQGEEGLCNLTAHLIARGGTENMSKSDIDKFIYPMAASYDVSVDKEATTFTFMWPVDFADKFYPVLRDLMLHPAFDTSDFERVKISQLNSVTRSIRNSSDENYSKMVLENFLFANTPYQHMVSGTEAGVNTITLEDAINHYKTFFTRNNLLIGIAGNYSEDFLNRLKTDMDLLPDTKPALPEIKNPPMPDGINVKIVAKDDAFGSAIYMGFPIDITRSNDDFAALMIANSYLGEHRKSYGVLYNKIRETRSMNYGDYSYIEWYPNGSQNMLPVSAYPRHANYFSIWIRPVQIASGLRQQYPELSDLKLGHAHFAIRMALYQLKKLIDEGMSKEDFEITRDFMRSYMNLYIKTPDQRLGYLMDSRFYGRKDFIAEMNKAMKKLSVDDVNKAIKKYLQFGNMDIAIITTPEEAAALKPALLNNDPSPMSYSNVVKEGLSDEILAEDKIVQNFKLPVRSVDIIPTNQTFH